MRLLVVICSYLALAFELPPAWGSDLHEQMIASFRRCRKNVVAELEWTVERRSPLLETPLVTSYHAELRFGERNGCLVRFIKPRQTTILNRSDGIFRDGEVVRTSTTVNRDHPRKPGKSLGIVFESGRVTNSGVEPTRSSVLQLLGNNLFWGIFWANEIERYLSNAEPQTSEATSVIAASELGNFTAELNSLYGNLPSRLRISLGAEHIMNGVRLSEMNMAGGKGWPAGAIRSCVLETNEIEFAEQSSIPYIRQWTIVETYNCEAGETVVETTRGKVISIDFDDGLSAEDLGTDLEIPVYHPVTVQGANHLAYIWDGHWAVPAILDIDADGVSGTSEWIRTILTVTSLVIIAIALRRIRYRYKGP